MAGEDRKKERFEAEALIHIDSLHLATALRMTRNENEAEDLVQETFLEAFLDKFEEGFNCRAWLFKIMTNIFINNYRRKGGHAAVDLQDVDDDFLFGQLAALRPSENPNSISLPKVFDDDVKKAIEELPEDFRLVVVLSFLEGFSYQEIAEIAISLDIRTVKSRLHRGRKTSSEILVGRTSKKWFYQGSSEMTCQACPSLMMKSESGTIRCRKGKRASRQLRELHVAI